ncbi:putative RING finger domain protein [Lyophyllum shimeji]|uniref:RING finger domain protein n=1 Tax=Lyophyllum shimeji TaxID=47721 RepID=A0A9P3PTB0_LYOSH|nr:putative RING finger domain protein [Lyophyllum shimeji]
MVLTKRTRDGQFVHWTRAGQAPAPPSTPSDLPPPAKKSRTTSYTPPAASASSAKVTHVQPPPPPPPQTAYPSNDLEPGPSQPPPPPTPSRSRKKADPDQPPPEKRGAVFKKKCPQNILDRVERVMSQRFFMIDRQRNPGELKEVFSVLGSTGNVYTVTIDHKPSCNCPDHLKGNHCKHILFIFLKVLQVSQESGFWYQKALLTSELETIFAEAPLAPNSVAHRRIRDAHARAVGKATNQTQTQAQTNNHKRTPGPDDDCAICYETMHKVQEALLVWCEDCGNALHRQCFQEYRTSTVNSGKQLTERVTGISTLPACRVSVPFVIRVHITMDRGGDSGIMGIRIIWTETLPGLLLFLCVFDDHRSHAHRKHTVSVYSCIVRASTLPTSTREPDDDSSNRKKERSMPMNIQACHFASNYLSPPTQTGAHTSGY